ncbi:MAG: MFS transporter [Chloroflexota bacterium]
MLDSSQKNVRRIYLFMRGGLSFLLNMIFIASSIYQITTAGLSPLQLVLVGTVLEASVFLFEIPTGIVADVYSRKLSILIGFALIGLGFVLEGSFPFFLPILVAQVLWGVGYTFTSGATQAWVTDELGPDGEALTAKLFLRASQVSSLAAVGGIAAGSLLGLLRINLPIVLGGALLVALSLLLAAWMPETGFTPTPQGERSSWQQMGHIFRQGIGMLRRRPALGRILAIGLFYGLYSEGYDRLSAKLMLDHLDFPGGWPPVVWFGALRIVSLLLAVAAVEWVRRHGKLERPGQSAHAMFAATLVLVICLLAFAVSPLFGVTALLMTAISVCRSVAAPLYDAWVNQKLDSNVRATVISMSGQVDAFGQIAGGPLVGAIGNLSVRLALAVTGFILSPALWLLRGNRSEA